MIVAQEKAVIFETTPGVLNTAPRMAWNDLMGYHDGACCRLVLPIWGVSLAAVHGVDMASMEDTL